MAYDKPNRIKYAFYFDAGNNGNEVWVINGPKGKAGRLWDYGCEGITESFTSNCTLAIGTAADADHYGEEFAFGATAADAGSVSIRSTYREDESGFSTYMVDRDLPADVDVYMTLVDDSATGMAVFYMIVDWDD